jgi:nitrile hydratase
VTLYAPGAVVRVRDDWPEARGPAHIRTPHYLRGHSGTVLRALGTFADPEALAFARPAPKRALYHVAFAQTALWPDGRAGDEVLVELYEHWLEPPA